ncbi:matrixin family metalloprotease, partial [Alkaliphilus peptidifermentans]
TAVAGTLTLDAHWIPSVVTITYRGNGHTSGTVPANQTLTTPGSITLRPQGNLRRTGRVFIGWRDSAGNIFPPEASVSINVPVAGTLTLDAHWVDWIWHQDINATTGTNINRVGFWSGTGSINVHTHTLGTVSDGFVFHFRMLEAQQAWSNALDVPITGVTQAENAHIRSFGGQRADIDDLRGEGPSTWAGLAVYPTTALEQNIILDDTTRNVLRFSGQARIFVIERSTDTTWTQYDIDITRKVTVHELGHTLGWMGHTSRILADDTYVMWWQANTHFNLRPNEIRHLKQIYDHFR